MEDIFIYLVIYIKPPCFVGFSQFADSELLTESGPYKYYSEEAGMWLGKG